MAKNNIMYIIMFTIDVRHMLQFFFCFFRFLSTHSKFDSGYVVSSACSPCEIHLVATPYVISRVKQTVLKNEIIKMETSNINQQTKLYTV